MFFSLWELTRVDQIWLRVTSGHWRCAFDHSLTTLARDLTIGLWRLRFEGRWHMDSYGWLDADTCVRSWSTCPSGQAMKAKSRGPMALFVGAPYLSALAAPWLIHLALWYTWHPYEPRQTPSTPLHHWSIIIVRLGVIPSAFAWVIASSGTWGSLWLLISYFSWWLPSPRRLGATEELWHMLVIVCGWLRWLWGVLYLSRQRAER
jgi:hypothetical protein